MGLGGGGLGGVGGGGDRLQSVHAVVLESLRRAQGGGAAGEAALLSALGVRGSSGLLRSMSPSEGGPPALTQQQLQQAQPRIVGGLGIPLPPIVPYQHLQGPARREVMRRNINAFLSSRSGHAPPTVSAATAAYLAATSGTRAGQDNDAAVGPGGSGAVGVRGGAAARAGAAIAEQGSARGGRRGDGSAGGVGAGLAGLTGRRAGLLDPEATLDAKPFSLARLRLYPMEDVPSNPHVTELAQVRVAGGAKATGGW